MKLALGQGYFLAEPHDESQLLSSIPTCLLRFRLQANLV